MAKRPMEGQKVEVGSTKFSLTSFVEERQNKEYFLG